MALGTECLLGDPTLEEEFKCLKKRDLTETYLFQMACGSLRPQKLSDSAFRKHIMDKRKIFPATRPQPKHFDARPAIPASDLRGAAEFYTRFPGDKPAEHPDWISDRKAFREALNGMGDVSRWLRKKTILTDLEVVITERDRQQKRMSSPPSETSIFPPPPDATTYSREVEEVKSFLRSREACNLSKSLDWNGTGKLKRVDLCALFKKEGFFIQPERMNVLMSSLNSKDGNSVAVEDLAAGIQAWSGKYQEREEHKSNAGYWNADGIGTKHHLPTHGITLEEKDNEMGMQDVEVLAIMRRVLATTMSSCTSTLNGTMGKEVDHFRRLCFREYLKSIEQCQRWGLNVSQATLQKVLLHPGDMSMSSISKLAGKGHLSGWGGQEKYLISARTPKPGGANKDHKPMKKQSIRWADPNAFWPGKEDHVRLFLPITTSSPAMVLFQRIERTVAPSPGHWPVNHLGYSTSGDIEARKMYTL